MQKKPKLLFIGLNEFNREFIGAASIAYNLKNFKRLLALHETKTTTDDTYDSNYLEPWVQWVSLQTGIPSGEHRIKHLGDIPSVGAPQLWESLSDVGVTSGVWGAMNASRNDAKNCLFFVPDPWTFSENGYPEELDALLELPRYLATNYLNISKIQVAKKAAKLLKVLANSKTGITFAKELPQLIKNIAKFKGEHFVFISFTDFILAKLFTEYREKYSPQLSFIFMNTLAHLQHHHWHGDLKENRKLEVGLNYLDRALGFLFDSLKDEEVLVCTNGLSQMNTNHEKPWILYRQRDQKQFLESIGIKPLRVQPHMTHDAHIFFETLEDCMKAEEALREVTISGQKLFLVESYKEEPTKLFYRIDFTEELPENSRFIANVRRWPFFEHFEAIIKRTGKHIPDGTVFCRGFTLPQKIYNHDLSKFIFQYLTDTKPRETSSPVAADSLTDAL